MSAVGEDSSSTSTSMGAFDALNKKGTRALQTQKKITHVNGETRSLSNPRSTPSSGNVTQHRPPHLALNGKDRALSDTPSTDSRRSTPTTAGKSSPRSSIRSKHLSNGKRSSPSVLTPRFSDSDDDEETEPTLPRKRQKVNGHEIFDLSRRVRSAKAFTADGENMMSMIHAADIAYVSKDENAKRKHVRLFANSSTPEKDLSASPVPVELQYPSACPRERYNLVRPVDSEDFKPVDELINNIDAIARHYLPEAAASKISDEAVGLLYKLKRAYKRIEEVTFRATLDEVNSALTLFRESNVITDHLDSLHSLPLSLVETILTQIYVRTVSPRSDSLRRYENGTDNVYGELLPRFVSKILSETGLKSHHVFVDLGSGVGNVVLQVALQIGCESWGCEMMPNACELADLQHKEFTSRCHLWGLQPGNVHLERGDFLENQTTLDVLKRADLVLVNNQAFTPKLNDDLKRCFLDMKEGAQIVSLKGFVGEASKRNTGDIMNVFSDEKKPFWSGSVSWTDAPGEYHIAQKDSKRFVG